DERAHAAELLGLGEYVVDQRRLPGGLGAEDLDDAPARNAADPQGEIEGERAGGDRLDAHLSPLVAHAHDGALAELALDLGQRALQCGVAGLGGLGVIGHARAPWRSGFERFTVGIRADGSRTLGARV